MNEVSVFTPAEDARGFFNRRAWSAGAVRPAAARQTIVLPKGVRPGEFYAGHPPADANVDRAVLEQARKTYDGFIRADRSGDERTSHTVRVNHDGSTTIELERRMRSAPSLGEHYDALRRIHVRQSVAGLRTAAYAHNAAVRHLGRLARLHPAAATATTFALAAITIGALANRGRTHRRRHAYLYA